MIKQNLSHLFVNVHSGKFIHLKPTYYIWWRTFYTKQGLDFTKHESIRRRQINCPYLKPVLYSPYKASQCDKIPNRLKP